MKCRHQQQGVALITAVLIVALVTATAVAMAARQQLDVRRSGNIFNADQAWLAVLGGEDYARNVLEVDGNDNDVDNLQENWAQPVLFPFEGMTLEGQIEDMQGRFNLNNLIESETVNEKDLRRFERLLTTLELDASLAQTIVDWLDGDIEPRPNGGAEDDYYMLQAPPYRAANRLMVSPSELLLIKGVDKEVFQALQPFVTTLPTRTSINVNTAPAEVLSVIADGFDGSALVDARGEEGFASYEDFKNHPLLKDREISDDVFNIKSGYFLLSAMTKFDDAQSQLFSLLSRDAEKKQVTVAMRSRGAY